MDFNICINNMSKKYNGNWLYQGVSCNFESGRSYALVGKNGCGKSTFLRLLAGITKPTSGQVSYSRKISFAYVPDKLKPLRMTVKEYLCLLGEIEGLKKTEALECIDRLSKDFFIFEMLDMPMMGLSKGTLQKVLVIQALLKKNDVILLDEPLSGQDKESQKVFIQKINELRKDGVTVFMACHEMWLKDALSDYAFTFKNGSLTVYEEEESVNYILLVDKLNKEASWDGIIEKYGSGYKLIVKEEDVKDTIIKLWSMGWSLKGMYDEIAKISD